MQEIQKLKVKKLYAGFIKWTTH